MEQELVAAEGGGKRKEKRTEVLLFTKDARVLSCHCLIVT